MGCWAVPSVAAGIWGVSVRDVLRAIDEGRVLSRVDSGLLVVDVEPSGMPASRRRKDLRPATYRPVGIDQPLREQKHDGLTASSFSIPRRNISLVRRPPLHGRGLPM